jgi:hypothetical protein
MNTSGSTWTMTPDALMALAMAAAAAAAPAAPAAICAPPAMDGTDCSKGWETKRIHAIALGW